MYSWVVLTFILLLLGNAIGGQNGIFIALIMAGFMNFFSYWYSDKIVLSMYGAQPVDKKYSSLSIGREIS